MFRPLEPHILSLLPFCGTDITLRRRLEFMTSPVSMDEEHASKACARFFSIQELVTLFLEQASPQVLINCQRVCTSWNDAIARSQQCQEHLFFTPTTTTDRDVQINPLLSSHFSPILAPPPGVDVDEDDDEEYSRLARGNSCNATHLAASLWAKDGTSLTARSRLAFARPEASWRKMLLSQPPMTRLDWWHEWIEEAFVFEDPDTGDWQLQPEDMDAMARWGWGHDFLQGRNITIGMLWDLTEARLVRGCWTRVIYFPKGKAIPRPDGQGESGIDGEDDYDTRTTSEERLWAWSGGGRKRGWNPQTPRVKLLTRQVWTCVPRQPTGFDMEVRRWKDMSGSRWTEQAGNGHNVLGEDCRHEREHGARWSKSEAFEWCGLKPESGGFIHVV